MPICDLHSPGEEILEAPAGEDAVGELCEERVHGEQRGGGPRDDAEDNAGRAHHLPWRRPLDLRHLLRHPGQPAAATSGGGLLLLPRPQDLLQLRRHRLLALLRRCRLLLLCALRGFARRGRFLFLALAVGGVLGRGSQAAPAGSGEGEREGGRAAAGEGRARGGVRRGRCEEVGEWGGRRGRHGFVLVGFSGWARGISASEIRVRGWMIRIPTSDAVRSDRAEASGISRRGRGASKKNHPGSILTVYS